MEGGDGQIQNLDPSLFPPNFSDDHMTSLDQNE